MATLLQTGSAARPVDLEGSVTEEKVREIVRLAVAAYDPVRVIAFGSWARGESGPESDLDLAIIVDDDAPQERRRGSWLSHPGVDISLDVIVATRSAHQRFAFALDSVHYDIAKEGLVLYDRKGDMSANFYPVPSEEELVSIQSESLSNLVKRALSDEKILNIADVDVENAAFHGQQALEKWMKIWLTSDGSVPPRIHELEDLEIKLQAKGLQLPALPVVLKEVTEYATTWRYTPPVDSEELDLAPLKEAVRLVREHVVQQLNAKGIAIQKK